MDKLLIFKDFRLEQDFKKYYQIDTPEKYKFFMYVILIYGIAYLISSICYYFLSNDEGSRQGSRLYFKVISIFIICTLFFVLSLLIMKNIFSQSFNIDIIVFILGIIIQFIFDNPVITKDINLCITDMGQQSFWEGYEIQFYSLLVCSLFNRWIYRIVFFLTSSIYFYFYKSQIIDDKLEAIKIIGFTVAYGIMVYYFEKTGRIKYLQLRKLIEKEKTWKEITDSLPEGVLVVNKNGKSLYMNHTIEGYLNSLENSGEERKEIKPNDINYFFNRVTNLKLRNSMEELKALYKKSMSLFKKSENLESLPNEEMADFLIDQEANKYISFFEGCTLKNLMNYSNYSIDSQTINDFITFDGSFEEKSLEIKAKNIQFDGELVLLMIFIDTTHRDLISRLEQNDKYKNIVLSTVSHELRTPLNSAICMLQTAIDSDNISQYDKNELIFPSLRSLNMLASLINDILDYSQIQANKLNLVYQNVDLRQIIFDACALFEIQCKKKNIKLSVDIAKEIPSYIRTDPNRLTQIILNLLSNAIKFTKVGYVKISVKWDSFIYRKVTIAVEDTGIGIKPEEMDKLFQDYGKIDLGENAKLNATGCGLGLSISQKLAMRLDSHDSAGIRVESQFNKGSIFSFSIEDKQEKKNSKSEIIVSYKINPENHEIQEGKRRSKCSILSACSPNELGILNANLTKSKCTGKRKGKLLLSQENSSESEIEEGDRENVFQNKPAKLMKSFDAADENKTPSDSSHRLLQLDKQNILNCCAYKPLIKIPKLLIIDDDAMNLYSIGLIAKKLDYICDTVDSAEESFKLLKARNICGFHAPYDIIFVDFNMPNMDGLCATKIIKNMILKKELPSMMIIGCTAFLDLLSKEKGLEAGMDYVIEKPITKKKLSSIVNLFRKKV